MLIVVIVGYHFKSLELVSDGKDRARARDRERERESKWEERKEENKESINLISHIGLFRKEANKWR